MRRVLGISCFGVLLFLLRCNGKLASDDAGADATGPCATYADCPAGMECEYPVSEGCAATKQCVKAVACKGTFACACDGTQTSACNGTAPKPVAHLGFCDGGPGTPTACPSGLACENCDITGYTPVVQAKPRVEPGACTSQEILAFVTACYSSQATQTTCAAWMKQDSGACASCVQPVPMTDASWGPIVCGSSSSPCEINTGGCVDLVQQTVMNEKSGGGAGSCGDLLTAENGCLDYACLACPPADFQTCDQSATANVCKSYVDLTTSTNGPCAAIAADAGAAECFPQNDADAVNFVNVFCGTGP